MVIAIANGEILENYPEDQRGHSCLVLGYTRDGKALHAVCGYDPSGTLVIITVYFPEPPKWKDPKTIIFILFNNETKGVGYIEFC